MKSITRLFNWYRYLFGRKEKIFRKLGKVEVLGGKILAPRIFLIPRKNFNEIAQFLTKEKVEFKVIEV